MLKDRVVLITGGGKGIGAAIAEKMASRGARVIINYSHSEAAAKQVRSGIRRNGGKADIFCCDVSDHNSVKAMMGDIIQHYGRLDILVNNAGYCQGWFADAYEGEGFLMKSLILI